MISQAPGPRHRQHQKEDCKKPGTGNGSSCLLPFSSQDVGLPFPVHSCGGEALSLGLTAGAGPAPLTLLPQAPNREA